MTQDEIIEMAREAGFKMENSAAIQAAETFANLVADKAFQNGYEKGIAAFDEAVSLEREACAKVCEDDSSTAVEWSWEACVGAYFARAIRARTGDKND